MRFIVIAAVVLASLGLAGASMAQQGSSSTAQPSAPVGHRQPHVKDVSAQPRSDEAIKQLERDLDKKLMGICRGC